MGKKVEDRPESIKVRVITPEGSYRTIEVTRTDMKKSLAAKVPDSRKEIADGKDTIHDTSSG